MFVTVVDTIPSFPSSTTIGSRFNMMIISMKKIIVPIKNSDDLKLSGALFLLSYNTAEPKPFIAEDMSSAALAPAFTEGPEVVEECTSLEEWEVEGKKCI